MERITVKQIFTDPAAYAGKEITVAGWARTIRASNAFGFIELNDGSYFTNIQIVFEESKLDNYKLIAKLYFFLEIFLAHHKISCHRNGR